jgi:hypothetical protein
MSQSEHVECEPFADFADFADFTLADQQFPDTLDFTGRCGSIENSESKPIDTSSLVTSMEPINDSILINDDTVQRPADSYNHDTEPDDDDDNDWANEWASAEPITSTSLTDDSTVTFNSNTDPPSQCAQEGVSLNGLEKLFKEAFDVQDEIVEPAAQPTTFLTTLFIDSTAKL